jgi:hypothetical protein
MENYRIKIKAWEEIKGMACIPVKHVEYWVQKRYFSKSWFARTILKEKDIWYDQSCHDDENQALIAIRNLYNRENPTTTYLY